MLMSRNRRKKFNVESSLEEARKAFINGINTSDSLHVRDAGHKGM